MLSLYVNIKKYRKEHDMTQTDLAVKAGYADKSMIAKIEAGKIDLTISKIELFADIFQICPAELMGWNIKHDDAVSTLKANEQTLLTGFRKLNTTGQEKAIDYVEDLTENEKYTKDTELLLAEGM